MEDQDILQLVKTDLQISVGAYDDYLLNLIAFARAAIGREGIALAQSTEDGMLVAMYTAYLYRKRRENAPMPRILRYALNNRLFSQKAGGSSGHDSDSDSGSIS